MERIDDLLYGLTDEALEGLTKQQDDYIFTVFNLLQQTPEEFLTLYVFETDEIIFEPVMALPFQFVADDYRFKVSQSFRIRRRTPKEAARLEELGGVSKTTIEQFEKALKVYHDSQ